MRPFPFVFVAGVLTGLSTITGACASGPWAVRASVDEELPMRITVEWSSVNPGTSWVEFGGEGLIPRATPATERASSDHQHVLLGLPPYQEIWYEAVTLVDGVHHYRRGELTTGGLPAELPEMTVTIDRPDLRSDADYLLGTMFGQTPGLFAIDRAGGWGWFDLLDTERMPVKLERERDGGGFLVNTFADDYTQDDSAVHRLSLGEGETWSQPTPLAHHAYTQLPGGALAWLALDVREWRDPDGELVDVVGDAVMVLDKDGGEHVAFTTWDWLEPVVTRYWEDDLYELGKDWTHANALRWDDERGTLLLSLRNLETVVELWVDQRTWETLPMIQLGGVGGSALMEESAVYHPVDHHDFDNLHNPSFNSEGNFMAMVAHDGETHAVEWGLDHGSRSLREIAAHGVGEALQSNFLGTVQELDNGNLLLTYSSDGVVRELTPEGEVAWELQVAAGTAVGTTLQFDDWYAL